MAMRIAVMALRNAADARMKTSIVMRVSHSSRSFRVISCKPKRFEEQGPSRMKFFSLGLIFNQRIKTKHQGINLSLLAPGNLQLTSSIAAEADTLATYPCWCRRASLPTRQRAMRG